MKLILAVVLLFSAGVARADSVAQEIRAGSVLTLKQGVAQFWADNLEAAQASVTYASAQSLELSIQSVIRAIGLEQSLAGLSYCNLTNCIIVNAQSTVAIDPNAGGGITPAALYFGEVTATPEPPMWLLSLFCLCVWCFAKLLGVRRAH